MIDDDESVVLQEPPSQPDNDGTQEGWIVAAREIRDEAELFAQIIESMPDGLVLIDDKGKIKFLICYDDGADRFAG